MTNTPTQFRNVKSGDLLFFSGRRVFSRVIQLWTRSRWSHVGMAVRFDQDLYVLESLECVGVRLVPLSVWLQWPGDIAIGKTCLEQHDRDRLVRIGLQHLGERYASPRQFLRSFSIVWSRLSRHWRLAADTSSSRWLCSEFVAYLLRSVGYLLPDEPARISPARLAMCRHFMVLKEVAR